MTSQRLRILYLSHLPPSPPRFGAQARIHGLMTNLAQRHDLTAISLVDPEFDLEDCRRAMQEYCREVILLRNTNARNLSEKRILQIRSLASFSSFERLLYSAPELQDQLDTLLCRERFDVVNLEFPYLAHLRLRQSPPGAPTPAFVIDTHEIAYDLVRQFGRNAKTLGRRVYSALDWRKLRREERRAFRSADGICACSVADAGRVREEVPSARTVVIPNAADVDYYQPRPSDSPSDGRTVLFFGLMSTLPNIDAVTWFVRAIWPRIVADRPEARLRILGGHPPQSVRDLAGPRVEVAGFVEDLRPHLASATALVVPLRLGGGTRLKIVEGMAMGKAVVSTTLGSEGIEAVAGRDILIADEPVAFAASVIRLLDDPTLAQQLGSAARKLAVERYAWKAAAATLERFFREILAARDAAGSKAGGTKS